MHSIEANDQQNPHDEFRAAVSRFAQEKLKSLEDAFTENEQLSTSSKTTLSEGGYFGCTLPEAYGGSALSFEEYCIVLEEFSKVDIRFSLAVTMSSGPITKSIVEHGSPQQRETILPGVCEGNVVLAFALTEPEAGSDAGAIRTSAKKSGSNWILNGTKHYITYGNIADFVQVIATTGDREISCFLVRSNAQGFEVSRVDTTFAGEQLAELKFSDCMVPEDMLLGKPGEGFRIAMGSLDEGRIGIGAMCIGVAEALLEMAIGHAKTRQTFGKPLSERQAIQWMLADSKIELEASRALMNSSLQAYQKKQFLEVRTLASCLKVHASEMVGKIADRSVQIFGGAGLIRGVPIERIYRQVRHFRIGEGTSEIQRHLIAKQLIS
ncbi:MAG: acyl-CoA dehydrogenase family protein [Parvibaculaceae bacterium]